MTNTSTDTKGETMAKFITHTPNAPTVLCFNVKRNATPTWEQIPLDSTLHVWIVKMADGSKREWRTTHPSQITCLRDAEQHFGKENVVGVFQK